MARKKAAETPRPEYLVTTPVLERPCPNCSAPILTALCGGWPTNIDPAPVNALGEAVALLAKLFTYELANLEGGREPIWRHAGRISRPWPERWHVHADHRCGFSWPSSLCDGRDLAKTSIKDHCDF